MSKVLIKSLLCVLACLFLISCIEVMDNSSDYTTTKEIPLDVLKDKIKGGWAGQTIACTYGGPTEFRFKSIKVPDDHEIPWNAKSMPETYDKWPGLYDDIYMDLTFVEIFEKEGLDAPVSSFANAFANAEYMLWHANQCARYNILNGIEAPASGHWLNNPCADDIDYQIEADFSGLMSPGMVNTSAEISDKIGHIMNYGDGWYGGVYVGAMYSLAFVSDDISYVVEEALKVIPDESRYSMCMKDVIQWHKENPKDWKYTWQKVHDKWNIDVGCPQGVFDGFNIDAKINSAWILVGLLYGEKDFGKTTDIATRCGDDSDCNPASAAGILGTMIGYSNIPAHWKQGLTEVESVDFKYTTISLNDTYDMSYRQALEVIKRNGGTVDSQKAVIKVQKPKPVRLEVAFEGHYPIEKRKLNGRLNNQTSFEFDGIGFAVNAKAVSKNKVEHVFEVEMYIDGKLAMTTKLPTYYATRKFIPFWKYQMPSGKHNISFKVLNPRDKAFVKLENVIIYSDKPL
jgi:hypothetical protein